MTRKRHQSEIQQKEIVNFNDVTVKIDYFESLTIAPRRHSEIDLPQFQRKRKGSWISKKELVKTVYFGG